MNKLIIIGSGPAGLTSAIYAARADLKPILIAGVVYGGQLLNTTEVENYPGFPDGIMGPELMERMLKQAQKFGAEVVFENATQIISEVNKKIIKTYENTYEAEAVIIATGSTPRKLGIPGEDKFYGRGVSTCATCDAAFFKEKIVAVVGGGDSAMEESNFLTRFASKVYLLHRGDSFRASQIMQNRVKQNPKIEILFNNEIKEVIGETKVNSLKVFNNKTNQESELKVDGLFLSIGHIPVTDFVKGEVELDEKGYIKSTDGVHTNIEGIFTAGDVQDFKYKQAVTAAGAGCKAALEVQWWLQERH